MSTPVIIEKNERGETRIDGNAFIQDSLIEDPAEARVGSPKGPNCSGGGKISFDIVSRDANGNITTRRAIAEITCGEGVFGAELTISVLKKDGQSVDGDMKKAIRITEQDGIEFLLPVKGATGGGNASEGRFYHEDGGRFCTIYQGDGHVVTYDTTKPGPNGEGWKPLWGNWEGMIAPLPWV